MLVNQPADSAKVCLTLTILSRSFARGPKDTFTKGSYKARFLVPFLRLAGTADMAQAFKRFLPLADRNSAAHCMHLKQRAHVAAAFLFCSMIL